MLASMPNLCDQFYEFSPQFVSRLPANTSITDIKKTQNQSPNQQLSNSLWQASYPYSRSINEIYTHTSNQPSFTCFPPQQPYFSPSSAVLPMLSDQDNIHNFNIENAQEVPRTLMNPHNRESSFSSLGSAGPESPFTVNVSLPQIVGDFDLNDIFPFAAHKIFSPTQTPSPENLLGPPFSTNFQSSPCLGLDILPMSTMSYQDRTSIGSNLDHSSPTTSPLSERSKQQQEQQKQLPQKQRQPLQQQDEDCQTSSLWINEDVLNCDQAHRNRVKLDQVMAEIYEDSLYNPNSLISAAPSPSTSSATTITPIKNEIFETRLQPLVNHQLHNNSQAPLNISSRECANFCQSPSMATNTNFRISSPSLRIGTTLNLREQQKAENDVLVLQEQFRRGSSTKSSPNTISPKDVDMVYQEDGENSMASLLQSQKKMLSTISIGSDESISQKSYGGMATLRHDRSSTFSSSQPTLNQNSNFTFSMPMIEQDIKCTAQPYLFHPTHLHQQSSEISNTSANFQPSRPLKDTRSGDFESDTKKKIELQKPAKVSANTGTYTCTYHGCTLRFDTPARLQRHKREGHRSSSAAAVAASALNGLGCHGMTSVAHRNSQAGPHKCERINPSTGKPCNTVFSRPYDLTRHEDTIHNTQKQKVHCPICEDEKSFSRNDALTRHMRVVHPEYVDTSSRRRRGPSG
ncbi:putative c2h2 transcription factor protein [Erysiphe necator]|uniref:Putative c2h2 transcription factor protein n=1 Tax=Uncinula necator TaxID=52586 RepID=A0A0B1NY37_UNCNE|nr:putative c2h2 transcription factor protein [Erysiphe necator]